MDELINQITTKLGIDRSVAESAIAKVMAFVRQHADGEVFEKVAGAIPGAAEASESAATSEPESGGMLGSLAGMASGLVGGSTGDALELGSSLKSSGLDIGQIGDFASTVIDFLKDKVGGDTVDQLLDRVPPLKQLID